MSDLAAWPMPEHDGIVIHVHGSEHLITQGEWDELWHHVNCAFKGLASYGTDYTAMVRLQEAEKVAFEGNLLEQLGLKRKPAPLTRRRV